MGRYIRRRVLHAVAVLWLTYTAIFIAVTLLPSNPVTALVGQISDGAGIDPDVLAAMKSYYGYDRSPISRYLHQLIELASGDFGYSISSGQTVVDRIGDALPSTLRLAGLALIVAIVITALVAYFVYLGRPRALGKLFRVVPPLFSSVPPFWIGIVALQILSFQFGLMSVFPDGSLLSVLVPAIVLGIPLSAAVTQVLLQSIDATYRQEFVEVARAKGAGEAWVFFRHVLKNASAPTLTVAANIIGLLVGGAVVTETVFSRSGVGSVLEQAVANQDLALIQGFVLMIATVFVVVNLAVDLIYPLLDPRIVRGGDPARA
ncbi:Glutathione transport system permease protein GsiC [Nocardia cerradoensis]|uniref:Glutathione transport system permease protein GsiC n=1 Tax=Nocardia cerradoensis TaxID=85688 RepID=A0A231HDB0_9NOCA|nr:ABC transporter permease [Nocardia cerradoensis]OXR46910.1 Glutathione transport system permease protein GsiC [Nocardia cerradoensis]